MNPVNTHPNHGAPPSPEVANLISQMHDIEAPKPIGLWPIAPGWWLLIILSIFTIYGLVRYCTSIVQRGVYRRQALQLLTAMNPSQTPAFATEVSNLLKRVALAAYPKQRSIISQAHGTVWVNWLNQHSPKSPLSADSTKALSQAPYQTNIEFDAPALKLNAKAWIKNHV